MDVSRKKLVSDEELVRLLEQFPVKEIVKMTGYTRQNILYRIQRMGYAWKGNGTLKRKRRIEAFKSGASIKEIAASEGVLEVSVSRFLKKYLPKEENNGNE